MNEVQIFKNPEFGSIRVLEIDGAPYWVAVDIAVALGYKRTRDAVTRHCEHAVKHRVLTRTGEKEAYVIPESDLYRLIVHSKLPKAKAFEKWVFEDVLPQIRRTGSYSAQALEPVSSADIQALRDEIQEIKNLISKSQFPALTVPRKDITYKAYINAGLDILEKQCGQPRSTILHRCYTTFGRHGYDVETIKADYMERHNLNQCSIIDAICDDPLCVRNLVYLIQSEIITGMDKDIDSINKR